MESVYEIDKNVPLPEPVKRYNYPYDLLQVGESFWVSEIKLQRVCNLNNRQSKKLGRTFICRREGDGVRVWRTA